MISRIVTSVSNALDFNIATLSGCIDIIVVPDENGSLRSTPFHVRFGKAKLLRSREKIVSVAVNGQATDLQMILGSAGEAYFMLKDEGQLDIEAPPPDHENSEYNMYQEVLVPEGEEIYGDEDLESVEETMDPAAGDVMVRRASDPILVKHNERTALEQASLPAPSINIQESGHKESGEPVGVEKESGEPLSVETGTTGSTADQAVPQVVGHFQSSIQLSLCGHLLLGMAEEEQHDQDVFQANLLDAKAFERDATLWYNPSLVFRFGNKPPYFPARTSLPLIASWAIFGKSLTKESFLTLLRSRLRLRDPQDLLDQLTINVNEILHPAALPDPSPGSRSRRPNSRDNQGAEEQRYLQHLCYLSRMFDCCMAPSLDDQTGEEEETLLVQNGHQSDPEAYGATTRVATARAATGLSTSSKFLGKRKMQRYIKCLKPTPAQLAQLRLQPGANRITFSVTSALQGFKSVSANLYLWPRSSRIVVSDVDGTITKSDLWGQLMPIVGKDWSHPGVAELFTNITKHNYRIVYLTARAIGQADSTRDYLFGLTQNEKKLPDGPLILSPDRLFPSFKREVIDRKPFVFKIAALRDLRSLFPHYYNPYYAGFGNRDTDHRAYVHVGVPEARIFIIDPTGHVHHVNRTFAKTYKSMSTMANDMFPPLKQKAVAVHADDEYNDVNYWGQKPDLSLCPAAEVVVASAGPATSSKTNTPLLAKVPHAPDATLSPTPESKYRSLNLRTRGLPVQCDVFRDNTPHANSLSPAMPCISIELAPLAPEPMRHSQSTPCLISLTTLEFDDAVSRPQSHDASRRHSTAGEGLGFGRSCESESESEESGDSENECLLIPRKDVRYIFRKEEESSVAEDFGRARSEVPWEGRGESWTMRGKRSRVT
ncbi:LNS2 (lipin/Ned1/Smp2) protein [Gregarina niphandrodes]|uniref:phosphatidate phosphatase n=1 Tax=Gregarina niphandrodes TaxID=110365 RepID=A0A023B3E0_GRENI|nr:LNS2 (lipin/Ned1/Smp2) protein [Gregarina niphandrodes]EZG55244.1 LNS2 (lipin/Ned1/Smp2) protein [Gregarina niphandrodes]|eukprot:XP_011131695.1 LNS2 (lipin/Ned1/Smp2) protein [Gregarina niphandrodes]